MGPAKQLYCAWHILRAWENHLRSNIKNKDKQIETCNILKALMNELDVFHVILEKVLDKWKNDSGL